MPAEGATSLPPKVLSAPGLVGQEPTLKSQEDGLRFGTGQQNLPGVAGNIAEYYDIPLAAPHCFPVRIKFLPRVPYRPEPNSLIPTRPSGRTDPAGSARHTPPVGLCRWW